MMRARSWTTSAAPTRFSTDLQLLTGPSSRTASGNHKTMTIETFDQLLRAARAEPQPQRLLFVLAAVELPDDATPDERAGFDKGEGGALVPQMCVDKSLEELVSFAQFKQEANQICPAWGVVFAAALSGHFGRAPTSEDAEKPLQSMVDAIGRGQVQAYIPFNLAGEAMQLA
jgi:hypothetical protein